MLFVYVMTGAITGLWLIDVSISGKIIWKRSWLDYIFGGVLVTQLLSSLITMDRYTSFFGYYSRFHGGFWSTLCYILLALIFKNYATKKWVENLILSSLASASIVSLYAIGEHFGIDAQYWVQDVQNRVFSTLGQPNWLSAWLGALLPFAYLYFIKPPKSFWPTVITLNSISIIFAYILTYVLTKNALPISGGAFALFILIYGSINGLTMLLAKKFHEKLSFLPRVNFLFLIILMQFSILFTKSRSGFLALMISTVLFFIHRLISGQKSKYFIPLIITVFSLIMITGTEWTPSLAKLMGKSDQLVKNPLQTGSSNPRISDSTDIRKVVWEGAVKVWQHYPLLGSGTETFAYSYYNFRPAAHNLNSEWDFLYNKAHNEYLNFLANNGTFGTAAIFALIVAVIWMTFRDRKIKWLKFALFIIGFGFLFYLFVPKIFTQIITKLLIYPPLLIPLSISCLLAVLFLFILDQNNTDKKMGSDLDPAILASMVSIFISNFYGFSVVTIGLLFFLLPVFIHIFQIDQNFVEIKIVPVSTKDKPTWLAWIGSMIAISAFLSVLVVTVNYYQADLSYNFAENYLKMGEVLKAEEEISNALTLHSGNANYWLQKGLIDAQTAFLVNYKDASDSSGLVAHYTKSAVTYTQQALLKNQVHVNLYKSAARVYITLGLVDPQYIQFAIKTLEIAAKLSPTDPQIPVNTALLYQQGENYPQAEELFQKAIALKTDYLQAHFLLAQMYEEQKDYKKAAAVYQNVLNTLDSIDINSTQKLKEFRENKFI